MINLINYEAIHTQSRHEIELRIRAKEEQRFRLGLESAGEETGRVNKTSNPDKARPTGFFAITKTFLQAMIGTMLTERQGRLAGTPQEE